MSNSGPARNEIDNDEAAAIFAALGDPTRLALVTRLSDGAPRSITQLTEDSALTRQAITKHLQVLEEAGVLTRRKSGRESLYAYSPQPLHDARQYMDAVGRQWEQALGRLKAFTER